MAGRSQTVAAVFGQLFGDDKGRALAPCYHSVAAHGGRSGGGRGGGGRGGGRGAGGGAGAAAVGAMGIRGYMSVESHHSRALQFLFVNQRPVLRSRLHKALQQHFARSTICSAPRGTASGYVRAVPLPA